MDDLNLDIFNYSISHITSIIQDTNSGDVWSLTGFYGQPETCKRVESWDILDRVNKDSEMGWCILSDFNEIATQDKKIGGRPRRRKQMEDFKLALERNVLVDLGWKNHKFTWSNKHK